MGCLFYCARGNSRSADYLFKFDSICHKPRTLKTSFIVCQYWYWVYDEAIAVELFIFVIFALFGCHLSMSNFSRIDSHCKFSSRNLFSRIRFICSVRFLCLKMFFKRTTVRFSKRCFRSCLFYA